MRKEIVAQILAERKINQNRMAKEIGMRPQRLSDMLKGRLKGWKYRSRISKYLGIPEEVLFDDENDLQSHSSAQNSRSLKQVESGCQ